MGGIVTRCTIVKNSHQYSLAVYLLFGALGCRRAPAGQHDAGLLGQPASTSFVASGSTTGASISGSTSSEDLPPELVAEALPDHVSSGCGPFRFALTPGRVTHREHGPGTMDATLSVSTLGSSAAAQRLSLKIDTDYQGVPVLDPEVVCGDFDFDGHGDFAVNNARNGSYGGPSYAVFLYRKQYVSFVLSRQLSSLTEESFGFPVVDALARRLVVSSKSGCCVHWTSEYDVIGGAPRRMKTVLEEEKPSGICVVTTEIRRGERWIKSEVTCADDPTGRDDAAL